VHVSCIKAVASDMLRMLPPRRCCSYCSNIREGLLSPRSYRHRCNTRCTEPTPAITDRPLQRQRTSTYVYATASGSMRQPLTLKLQRHSIATSEAVFRYFRSISNNKHYPFWLPTDHLVIPLLSQRAFNVFHHFLCCNLHQSRCSCIGRSALHQFLIETRHRHGRFL
jgi:hypothetical protein